AAVAWPLPDLVVMRHALSLPDSRHVVKRWIDAHVDPNKPIAVELYGPVFQLGERAMVIWPFFATQSQLARPTYHPEFLDGIQLHVASGEISRRFQAEPAKYPVENAYYSWLRDHATVVWESKDEKMSGPHIVVRRLPPNISTRARRDSIFNAAMPVPNHVNRVELWAWDFAKLFARVGDHVRAEEWARRGLEVEVESMEGPLRNQLAMALYREGKIDTAETEMRIAIQKQPKNPTFRINHASMLSEMGRLPGALQEARNAYELSGRDPRVHINIAQVLGQMGRYDEAVSELLQVAPGNPQRGLALRDAAILLLNHSDRPDEALDLLRESIQLDPNQEQSDLVRQQIARLEAVLRRK
ncbi:MAG TPA: tetratricopeptide repeat protein, partial [Methylomirabilota bacterium]|nr:tetratricopeptide repeat protein [Methylomirabilota bacterium]